MKRSKCILIAQEIRRTIERLHARMKDRFPQSNLANICKELHEISKETDQTVEWIAKPNYLLRFGTYGLILIAAPQLTSVPFAERIVLSDCRAENETQTVH
jgi:hypothetical protein